MNEHNFKWLIIGVIVGMAALYLISLLPISTISIYHAAIEECEKELPRNQSCKITAVIEVD